MNLCSVSDLFHVRQGSSLELNALDECAGGVPFVSRTTQNNGVSAFVAPIAGVAPLPGGVLSVALSGSPLATFLQEESFYSGYHVATLTAKAPMSRDVLLYYAACLQANRYRFSYGRQANRSLASLMIPALSEVPAWVEVADARAPKGLWGGLRSRRGPLPQGSDVALSTDTWKSFAYDELFEVKKGKRLTKDDMSAGDTLYIGATEYGNGVTGRIGQEALHAGGLITVSYNGSVAEAFYQPEPFWASDDVNVFYPRFEMSREIALFIVTLIRLEKYRYNYGRKWRLDVMKATTVRLPATGAGAPDWAAMASLIKSLPSHQMLGSSN